MWQQINGSSHTMESKFPILRGGSWHIASGTSCGAAEHSALAMLQSPLRALYLFTKSKLILCKFAEVSALTHYDRWPSGKPGFDFPTDGSPTDREEWSPAPSVLAQWLCWHRPKAEHPLPLFPGPWECNTLLTKSHFPFLSNFHTPAPPLSLPWLACPQKWELGWHAYDSFNLFFSHHFLYSTVAWTLKKNFFQRKVWHWFFFLFQKNAKETFIILKFCLWTVAGHPATNLTRKEKQTLSLLKGFKGNSCPFTPSLRL